MTEPLTWGWHPLGLQGPEYRERRQAWFWGGARGCRIGAHDDQPDGEAVDLNRQQARNLVLMLTQWLATEPTNKGTPMATASEGTTIKPNLHHRIDPRDDGSTLVSFPLGTTIENHAQGLTLTFPDGEQAHIENDGMMNIETRASELVIYPEHRR